MVRDCREMIRTISKSLQIAFLFMAPGSMVLINRTSISMIELNERHLKDRVAQRMNVAQEKQVGELLAARSELRPIKLADELKDRLCIRSVVAAEHITEF